MLALVLALVLNAQAKMVEGVDVPEQTKLGEQTLVLNGAGVRKKFFVRVYVGALYAAAKSADASKLLNAPAVVELSFLRDLDKSKLVGAWTEGVEKNCTADCDQAKIKLKELNDLMVDVKNKDKLRLEFAPTGVTVTFSGHTSKTGRVEGEAFRKAMLNVFIGPHPPTEDLKKALLGS